MKTDKHSRSKTDKKTSATAGTTNWTQNGQKTGQKTGHKPGTRTATRTGTRHHAQPARRTDSSGMPPAQAAPAQAPAKVRDKREDRRGCPLPSPGSRRSRGKLRGCKGEFQHILAALLDMGWKVLRSKRHMILQHDDFSQKITLPRTSSDHRARLQAITCLRRMGVDLRPGLQGTLPGAVKAK